MLDLAEPIPSPRLDTVAGMNEPGIFKGCRGIDGPLPGTTKNAILIYLGKPNAAAWDKLRKHAIVGRISLGEAWTLSNPGAARRFPTSVELIRAMRVAVISQWAGSVVGPARDINVEPRPKASMGH